MSETLSQDPDNLSSGFNLTSSYPSTPATPSSTVQDASGSNLPPFSSFSAEMDGNAGFCSDRLFTDTRLLDISSWDYYGETRLLERSENGLSVITSQPQYRPWESKPIDSTSQESLRQNFTPTTSINSFADAFSQNGVPKLPSFQSQFQTFNESAAVTTTDPPTLTTLTNLTPVSPNSSSPSNHLTTLNSNFHTLSAVNTRNYPLVPAPIQAREIPSIQQQFLDERHIQLYTHPTTNLAALNNTMHTATIFPAQNGAILQNNQIITAPTVVTVLKSEPTNMIDVKLGTNLSSLHESDLKIQNVTLHHAQFQNPMSTVLDNNGLYNGLDKKINGINVTMESPTRNDFRKKERRKMRASSLESSAESDGASSNMEVGSENSGQVASVSSTASFKSSHHVLSGNSGIDPDEISGGSVDKQVKKKRKRCGECIGCQRKDNCGDCAPCRNDKSHQICKQRRCEKLTEKKLYGDEAYIRGDSRRGRGKGRGAGSYRGRKPSGPAALPTSSTISEPSGTTIITTRPSPQPVHILKPEQSPQQTMTPMPFYADPNRFSTPVWQADPSQGWPQGQFIQQIPAGSQPTIEGYTQYPNGIYQTAYQQTSGFESNTFYAGAVQVLTRPPSAPNQTQLTTRPNGSYSHTPSPVSTQPQQSNQRTHLSGQYQQQEYSGNSSNYAQADTTPTGNVDSSQSSGMSRPSSVNSVTNVPSHNQNFQTQHASNFTPISSSNFSPVSNASSSFVTSNINTSSGNAMPGYPPVSSNPQLASHTCSGGYPGNDMSGQTNTIEKSHSENRAHWADSAIWEENSTQDICNNESAKLAESEIQFIDSRQNHLNSKANEVNFNNPNKSEEERFIMMQAEVHEGMEQEFSQSDRINLNSRLKTMILNKQQQQLEHRMETQKIDQNKTGHFLSYSHHHTPYNLGDGGGVKIHQNSQNVTSQQWNNGADKPFILQKPDSSNTDSSTKSDLTAKTKNQKVENTFIKFKRQYNKQSIISPNVQTKLKCEEKRIPLKQNNNMLLDSTNPRQSSAQSTGIPTTNTEKAKAIVGFEIPPCNCLPHGLSPEPGSYYTHLGCGNNLPKLRKDLEDRTGVTGKALRIEKICYTGKEGKTPQGCPIAKWILRRANYQEKYLIIVKQRPGHFCYSAVIVVCIIAWEGVLQGEADTIYNMLCEKLDKFGLPTNRRCGTNEPRTCACQGLDSETCGASFSFGCSWSMYYNGCKYARSKTVRKFRLSVKSEEDEVENRLQLLATNLTPLYQVLAPDSYKNQCRNEHISSDCRLGLQPGRPFSGVTACLDFCAHAHKDSHNMNNGCTVVVTLTKHRDLCKPDDEQLHVLPLYVIDNTDEFGSREDQEKKVTDGSIEVLYRYKCEVRVRNVPQQSCRRKSKKKMEELNKKAKLGAKEHVTPQTNSNSSNIHQLKAPTKQLPKDLLSVGYDYDSTLYYNATTKDSGDNKGQSLLYYNSPNNYYKDKCQNTHFWRDVDDDGSGNYSNGKFEDLSYSSFDNTVLLDKQPDTALNLTYPYLHKDRIPHSSTTAIKPPSHVYNNFNHKSLISQIQPNAALNMNNTEYKHSELFDNTSLPPKISSPNKINTDYLCNNNNNKIRKNLYQSFVECDVKNTDIDFTWRNKANNEYNLVNSPTPQNLTKSVTNNYPTIPYDWKPQNLPPFEIIKNSRNHHNIQVNSPQIHLQNPFDDSLQYGSTNGLYHSDYGYDAYPDAYSPLGEWVEPNSSNLHWAQNTWSPPIAPKSQLLGEVIDVIDNSSCFNDVQMGGVAIALSHGSVLFECAKHELHATTALKNPNRKSPTRISLVFYQHRNLNKSKHGWDEHEEKMRLRKLDSSNILLNSDMKDIVFDKEVKSCLSNDIGGKGMMIRVATRTTVTLTTVFPMYPCIVTGPYNEGFKT